MKRNDWKTKNITTSILSVLFLTIGTLVFSVLCIYHTAFPFVAKRVVLFTGIACILLIALFAVSVYSVAKRKETLYKLMFSLFFFLLFCLILLFVLQISGFFKIVKDVESLQNYIARTGVWMPLFYILLQYLQVVLLPIPGTLSTVVGVALFGPFLAIIYSFVGILLGSFTAFFIGRKLGYKSAVWLVGEDTLNSWRKKMKGRDNLALTMMFLLPLFPDDVLCIISGLSSMSTKYFLVMVSITRLLSIVATCYSVEMIPLNTWWGILTWGILLIGFAVLFVWVYKNFDKIERSISKKFKVFKRKNK